MSPFWNQKWSVSNDWSKSVSHFCYGNNSCQSEVSLLEVHTPTPGAGRGTKAGVTAGHLQQFDPLQSSESKDFIVTIVT